MSTILQDKVLSQTENDMVVQALRNNPILQKYFETLAYNIAIQLAYCPVNFEEAPTVFERKRLTLRGQLDLLDTLGKAYQIAASTNQVEE